MHLPYRDDAFRYQQSTSFPECDLRSKPAISLLKEWLGRCDTHEICLAVQGDPTRWPTLLLSVGSSEEPKLRLIDCPEDCIYVTSSSCWDPQGQPILTTANLEVFRKDISESSLPRTIQDVIWMARALGFL